MKVLLSVLTLFAMPMVGCASTPPAASAPTTAAREPVVLVDGAKARELMDAGARLVDVRTPDEFAEKHLDGAENVPLDRIYEQDMGPKDKPIIVYCMKGGRARLAANNLHDRGYRKVYNLGRMDHWDKQ